MTAAILVINAGSSSIKFALFALDQGQPRTHAALSGQIEGIGARAHLKAKAESGEVLADEDLVLAGSHEAQHRVALELLLQWLQDRAQGTRIVAAGHRVVHGGELYSAPTRISTPILESLQTFVPLAPLHQPHNLNAIRVLAQARPLLPQVACFDTAFHRTHPPIEQLFALPRALTAEGVKRYGFHGLSYEFIARVLPDFAGARAQGRVVIAHLGNGASMCALRDGHAVASTMGFTAIDGLMMGTRPGSLDPGVLLHLMDNKGWDAKRLCALLYKESGLLGVSGLSQDMRTLLASNEPAAREAVDLFCHRITRELGSLAAAARGLDVLVFTGGIGEHAAPVRAQGCRAAEWLGVQLDARANETHGPRISTPDSAVDVFVIPTNEERMIALHTARMLD